MNKWEIEEYMSLPYLLVKVLAANRRKTEVLERVIQYDSHRQQFLVITCPTEINNLRNSVICFVHGGGWKMGNPKMFAFVGHFFARLGFPCIMAGYRLAPEFQHPVQLHDALSSLKKGMEVLKQDGLSVEKVIVAGQSAGAHLASLMVLNREEAEKKGIRQDMLSGLLPISGPLDLDICQHKELRKMIFDYVGSSEMAKEANPINYITGCEDFPVLCIHGDKDPWVELENSLAFIRKINSAGKDNGKLIIVEGGHHSDLANIMLKPNRFTEELIAWLNQVDKRLNDF